MREEIEYSMTEKKVFILRRAFRRVFNRIGCAGLLLTVALLSSYSVINFLVIHKAEESEEIMVYGFVRAIDKNITNRYYFAFSENLIFDLMLDARNAQEFELGLKMNDAVRVYAKKTILNRYLVKNIESPFLVLDAYEIERHHTITKYLYGSQVIMGVLLLLLLLIEYGTFFSKMQWLANRPK